MKSFYIFCLLWSSMIYSQNNIDKAVKSAEKDICDCTRKSLTKNGIDIIKLDKITNLYKKNNSVPQSEMVSVKKINNQINNNISSISKEINVCRENFKQNPTFKPYFKNETFISKLEIALNNNNVYYGPKLIRKLAKN